MEQRRIRVENIKKNIKQSSKGYKLIIIGILLSYFIVPILQYFFTPFFRNTNIPFDFPTLFMFFSVDLPMLAILVVPIIGIRLNVVRIKQNQTNPRIGVGVTFFAIYFGMVLMFSLFLFSLGFVPGIIGIGPDLIILAGFRIFLKAEKKIKKIAEESSKRLRVDKFLRLVKISDTVKVNDVLELLGMTKDEWMIFQKEYEEILKGINIENDRISIDSEKDIEQFVFLLDQHFKSWEEKDKMKAGKKED